MPLRLLTLYDVTNINLSEILIIVLPYLPSINMPLIPVEHMMDINVQPYSSQPFRYVYSHHTVAIRFLYPFANITLHNYTILFRLHICTWMMFDQEQQLRHHNIQTDMRKSFHGTQYQHPAESPYSMYYADLFCTHLPTLHYHAIHYWLLGFE